MTGSSKPLKRGFFDKELKEIDNSYEDEDGINFSLNPNRNWKDKYLWKTPTSASFDGWETWKDKTKKDKPIRWFIFDTLPDIVNKNIIWPVTRFFNDKLYWGFKHRFIKKHKYNVLYTTLEPGYYDPAEQILNAVFNSLHEYVEYQKTDGHADWECPEMNDQWVEMNRINDFWIARKTREEDMDRDHPFPKKPEGAPSHWVLSDKFEDHPISKKWSEVNRIRHDLEKDQAQEDMDNLIAIMKIREQLWY